MKTIPMEPLKLGKGRETLKVPKKVKILAMEMEMGIRIPKRVVMGMVRQLQQVMEMGTPVLLQTTAMEMEILKQGMAMGMKCLYLIWDLKKCRYQMHHLTWKVL